MMTKGGHRYKPLPETLAELPYHPRWLERLLGERRLHRTELSREACVERLQATLRPRPIRSSRGDDGRMWGEADAFSFYCVPVDGAWGKVIGIPPVALYGKLALERGGGTRIELRQTVPVFWFWQLFNPVVAFIVTVVMAALLLTDTWSLAGDPERTLMLLSCLPASLVLTVLGVRRLLSLMQHPMFPVIERLLAAEEVEGGLTRD